MRKSTGVMKMAQRPSCPSGRYWRVEAGNTLYGIAGELGTTVEELLNLNPGIDPDNLQVGQFICLPREFPPCPSGVFWEVAPGDTLYQIAQATATTVDALLAANPGIDPNNLLIGQKICIP
jgi:LysM repeat protein